MKKECIEVHETCCSFSESPTVHVPGNEEGVIYALSNLYACMYKELHEAGTVRKNN